MHPQLHLRILVAALVLATRLAAQQPADFEWLDAVKSPKDQRTLALLRVGPEGFHLLRWQEEQRDYTGKVTPAHPLLARLNPAGGSIASAPIPELEPGSGNTFRFAIQGTGSTALMAYSSAVGRFDLRVFDLVKQAWAGPASASFDTGSGTAAQVWFSRSPDGRRCCVYWPQATAGLSFAVFDPDFHVLRQGTAPWPAQLGVARISEVFCSNEGAILVSTYSASPGASTVVARSAPLVWSAGGSPVWPPEDLSILGPFSVSILLLKEKSSVFEVFYPKIGKKYAVSLEFSQNEKDLVTASGLAANDGPDVAESYFIYQINTGAATAEMVQNAVLPAAVHRAFQSDKDVAAKAPVPYLHLRGLDRSADGRNWLLVEKENAQRNPVELDEAALLRLDSTWKITAARRIEKYQQATLGIPRFFGSVAVCPAPKGWWALWNKGAYPSGSLMLTDCKSAGEPVDYELAGGAKLVLGLLPHTVFELEGKWYFVGESANGDRFGVGVLQRKGKQ